MEFDLHRQKTQIILFYHQIVPQWALGITPLAQETPELFAQGISDGWLPEVSCCGAASRELIGNMSFIGRKTAVALVQKVYSQMERC